MRRVLAIAAVMAMVLVIAAPAGASHKIKLDGPSPAIWLSDPEGVDGVNGIEQGDWVAGSLGRAYVEGDSATIRVVATGLVPGHTYSMWVVYFNDHDLCVDGCNGPDLAVAGAGVMWGNGQIARADGTATFVARIHTGDNAEAVGLTPPPPFAFAPYEAGENNEFHVVIRSHGPQIPGEVHNQLGTFGGGCEVNVGPLPEQVGDFPVPLAPGECGDVQLYVFT